MFLTFNTANHAEKNFSTIHETFEKSLAQLGHVYLMYIISITVGGYLCFTMTILDIDDLIKRSSRTPAQKP